MKRLTLAAIVLLNLSVTSLFAARGSIAAAGPLTRAILLQPDRVEILKVATHERPSPKQLLKKGEWIAGYPVIGASTAVPPPEVITKIAVALLTPEKYLPPGTMKRCPFDPGYVLRFWGDGKSVSVLICLKCSELQILPPAASGEPELSGYFDPMRKEIEAFLRRAFPRAPR